VKKLRDIDESRTATSLPTSWTWCRLGDIVMEFRYGTSRKCERVAKGTPVLRIPNIQDGLIDADDLKYTAMPKGEFEELKLAPGDLLLVRSNGSEDLVGRNAVARLAIAPRPARPRILAFTFGPDGILDAAG